MPSNQSESTAPATTGSDEAALAATQKTTTTPKKTFVGTILADIAKPFDWGAKEFGNVAKLFNAEDPKIQADLTAVSGMLQIIKLNIQEAPLVIVYLVKKAYPQFDEPTILTYLQTAINDLGLAEKITGEDLPSLLTSLAQHLLGVTDTGWKLVWDGLFKAISVVAVPGALWEKIISFAGYIYNVLVKPVVK